MSLDILVIGAGQYVTGHTPGVEAQSDKCCGVVALTLFDLRRRGLVRRIGLVARDGRRFSHIRRHLQKEIADRYDGLDISFDSFPDDATLNPMAYAQAIAAAPPGSAVIVATPDTTHAEIALAAIARGIHVLVLKPLVKTLAEHESLIKAARKAHVLVAADYHKRFDPMYSDARDRIRTLGDMSLVTSYMSQPKLQLEAFRAWAGLDSDISYYLNAHHVDFHSWALAGLARPLCVHAAAASGIACRILQRPIEDAITLTVNWENLVSGNRAIAVYCASWIAPRSDVYSQQRFFYMGERGELAVDQAHRGFTLSTDDDGFSSLNPLFMKYAPKDGQFAGQESYGYRSIETFIRGARSITDGTKQPEDFDAMLATAAGTRNATAILEAGRRSLDLGGGMVRIAYNPVEPETAIGFEIA